MMVKIRYWRKSYLAFTVHGIKDKRVINNKQTLVGFKLVGFVNLCFSSCPSTCYSVVVVS